jgi:hypothetical protein
MKKSLKKNKYVRSMKLPRTEHAQMALCWNLHFDGGLGADRRQSPGTDF